MFNPKDKELTSSCSHGYHGATHLKGLLCSGWDLQTST